MRLLKFEDFHVTVDPMLLSLKPFKAIWIRDKTEKKTRAINELSWIYFMEDTRSDYQYIVDVDERSNEIKKGLGMRPDWKPDVNVVEAQKMYASFKTSAALLLEDTRALVDKLRQQLKEIDLTAVDDKGKPIYTLNTITATIKQIPGLVKDLNEAEKAIAKEITESERVRGANEKSIYEDLL